MDRINLKLPIRTSQAAANAFSLIELLVVIAIIALLTAFALPAFNSIGQARGVSEAAYQVAAAVEMARSEAITRQTYVWLGLQNQTNSGNQDLRIGMVYSKDGTTSTTAANLQPIGRAVLIQRAGLVDPSVLQVSGLPSGTVLSGLPSILANSTGATFSIGQAGFTSTTVTVTPAGEFLLNSPATASATTTGFDPKIAIGLRQFRGTTASVDNDVAIIIDGSVGIPTIYRK